MDVGEPVWALLTSVIPEPRENFFNAAAVGVPGDRTDLVVVMADDRLYRIRRSNGVATAVAGPLVDWREIA